jgi:hypothetical protein
MAPAQHGPRAIRRACMAALWENVAFCFPFLNLLQRNMN